MIGADPEWFVREILDRWAAYPDRIDRGRRGSTYAIYRGYNRRLVRGLPRRRRPGPRP